MGNLTALKVKALKAPGRHADGDGLYLVVKPSGSRSWVLRAQVNGVRKDLGVGSEKSTTLAQAREHAAELKRQLRLGIDPVATKRAVKAQAASVVSFRDAASRAHASLKPGWRNSKHQDQWLATLETYAFPKIGSTPVDKVDAVAIIAVLAPIWLTVPETASRVKQRIKAVLDWAFANGLRQLEAPTRAIGYGLPPQPKRDRHFAALPYQELPALMTKLAQAETVGRLALRFTILTAARSGEVRKATWGEVSFEGRRWTVPADHMKAGREHVVPLSSAAISVLKQVKGDREPKSDELIFPGNSGKPLSDMTLGKVLKAATKAKATVHGCRSGFRDWAAETELQIPGAIVEAALAHVNPNRVEAAYRRTTYFDQRMGLMEKWATFLTVSKPKDQAESGDQQPAATPQ